MRLRSPILLGLALVAIGAAACTPAATTAPTIATKTAAPAATTPASAGPTTGPTTAPTAAGGGGATVNAQAVGTAGTILVDAKSGMTLYTFTQDVKDSGKSNCTAGCLATWPALTVAAGATPTGGSGVTGVLATITRADNGALQVTYNGLPLYFFKNDSKPGDLNGVYENWETVAP
jgi:predicted lipoprotein with Yx(FWY)xxD motif